MSPPNGIKSWIYRYKIADKPEKITLGHNPAISLANAKKQFIELSQLRRDGKNPKDIINNQKESRTNTVNFHGMPVTSKKNANNLFKLKEIYIFQVREKNIINL